MNKKYLNALLFGAFLVASTGTFTSCKDYDDDIDGLSNRIEEVAKEVAEIQKLINAGAVITNVESTEDGVKVTLSNDKTFELTNGANGAPGSVVSIGDNGNWFIDGVDTGKPSQGPQGEAGPAGPEGPQGPAGEDGQNGQDGTNAVGYIYYYPGTTGEENGYWVKVTVDAEGQETKEITSSQWTTSVSSGVVAVLSDGSLILRNVQGSQNDIVISLNGDTVLKSLVFQREMVLDGQNAFEYSYLPYKALSNPEKKLEGELSVVDPNDCDNLVQTKESYYVIDGLSSASDWSYVNPLKEVLYHMNPNYTDVEPFKGDLSVVSDDVDFITTRSNNASAQPTAEYVKHDSPTGMLTVGYRMAGQLVKDQENNLSKNQSSLFPVLNIDKSKMTSVAVQANYTDAEHDPVTSNYSGVYAPRIAVEAISYQEGAELGNFGIPSAIGTNHASPVNGGIHLYKNVQEAAENVATVQVAYNNVNGVNLHKLLSTHYVNNSQRPETGKNGAVQYWNSREELAAMDLYYKFDKVPFYVGSNKTSQSAHCIIDNAEGYQMDKDAIFVACGVTSNSDINVEEFTDESKRANALGSIGRTPLIRVSLVNNMGTPDPVDDEVVSVGYIKFKIVSPETPRWTKLFDMENFYYGCNGTVKKLTWHAIETKLLEDLQIQMSKEEFRANYVLSTVGSAAIQYYKSDEVDVNGQPIFKAYTTNLGIISELQNAGAESTDVLEWSISKETFEAFRAVDAANQGVSITEDGYETVVTYTRYVKYEPKDNLNHGISKEPIFMPIKVTMKYPKGRLSNKAAAYWYDTNDFNASNTKPVADESNMKELHLNVEVPETTVDGKAAACEYVNDLDDAFLNNTTRLHNYAGSAVFDNAPKFGLYNATYFPDFDDNDLGYYYYFTAKNNGKTVTGHSGATYTLTVDNTTSYKYKNYGTFSEANNTKLYANGEQIAWIESSTGKITYVDNATNAASEDLLNYPSYSNRLTDAVTIEVGVVAYNKCGILLPLENNTFDVKFLRPVYVEPINSVEYTDAVDGNENGATKYVADLVNLYDWREKRAFNPNYLSYYNYYGVKSITVDTKEIKTNISGQMKPLKEVSNGVEFHYEAGSTTTLPANPTWTDIQNHFGKLKYYNRTGTVVTFRIEVPVVVTYKWGTVTVWVEGYVNRTLGN